MFTGIVEEIGEVTSLLKKGQYAFISVRGEKILGELQIGDSVATNGVCLTVTSIVGNIVTMDVMEETMERTNLGELQVGRRVNLERAMKANGRFGGHMVSGHVDGTGVISKIQKNGLGVWYTIKAKDSITKYVVEKGSIAIDGISLTVATQEDDTFSVCLIPHTRKETTLSCCKVGGRVNLEVDLVGKYIEKFLMYHEEKGEISRVKTKKAGITKEWLQQYL